MAPKRKPPARAAAAAKSDPDGMFRGVSAFVVPHAVQSRRLEVAAPPSNPSQPPPTLSPVLRVSWLSSSVQVWKQRLAQMGGRVVQEKLAAKGGGGAVTHVLAADAKALLRELDAAWLHRFRGVIGLAP